MVGVITPTLVACNKGSSYSIHYAQNINCYSRSESDYQNLSTIKSAIKSRADIQPTQTGVNVSEINGKISTDAKVFQNIYFDLIASYTILSNKVIYIADWPKETDPTKVTS
ncbi:MAG: hypothetical protein MJ195_01095 [Mycoplasmoidaceae bacterium]|nr:hypothetical protein [Mycoplasmoidaceae bacterium]